MKNTTNNTKRIPAVTTSFIGDVLTISFSNGKTATINTAALSETIRQTALMHGLNAKLVDAAAMKCDPVTGMSATINDKIVAVMEIVERITAEDGTWNKVRATGEGSGANNGLLVRALMEVSGKDKVTTEDFISTLTNEQKAALRARERIATVIARLQREKLASVDVSDEFADFLGEE